VECPLSAKSEHALRRREERYRAQRGALRSIKGNAAVLALRRRCSKRKICSDDAMTDETKTEAKPAAADPTERPSAIPPDEMARLSNEIVGALKTVYDPEIPADIYELGLI
jgi:hypothetical protein